VFAVVAPGLGIILGVPAGVGLWAMASANADDAMPALPPTARQGLVGLAVVLVAATLITLLVTGSSFRTARAFHGRPRVADRHDCGGRRTMTSSAARGPKVARRA
jgi:hypothetical protein